MTTDTSDSSLSLAEATAAPQDGPGACVASPEPGAALPRRRPSPPLDRESRRRIGRNLRLLYTDVLDQPLPDRFTALLDSLSSQSVSREES